MYPTLPDQLLHELSECVAGQMGLHFPRDRWHELENGIRSAARGLGIADVASWTRSLLHAPLTKQQIEILANELTIGETYFFRDKRSFAVVGEHVLPELIRARRGAEQRLRIWSAGCCTGEEAYSIAILLDRIVPDLRDWQVTILATDVNPRFLHKAQEGVYGEWSFRDAPAWLRDSYFEPLAQRRFAIAPHIKKLVRFADLNLGEDAYPSLANGTNAMDLIFCRNVLMYFAPERAVQVVRNLHHCLVQNGWLVVSAVETSARLFSELATVSFEGATLYQRRDSLRAQPPLFSSGMAAPAWEPQPTPAFSIPEIVADAQPEASAQLSDAEPPRVAEEQPGTAAEPAHYREALALFERGQYAQAAQRLAPSGDAAATVASLTLLARIHANLGELAQARRWAEQAIAADKVNAASHYLHAMILQEQGAIEDALTSLKRTLYLAPDFLLAHFASGTIARQQGRRKDADRHFTNALDLLQDYRDGDVLPHTDGLVAGRLKEMVQAMLLTDRAA